MQQTNINKDGEAKQGGGSQPTPDSSYQTPTKNNYLNFHANYEALRQLNMQRNQRELQKYGFNFLNFGLQKTGRVENNDAVVSTKSKKRKNKIESSPTKESKTVRRSRRQRSQVEFFSQEDYSRDGIAIRKMNKSKKDRTLNLSFTVTKRLLIDKLTAEAYVRTLKLTTTEAKRFQITRDADETSQKKKRKGLKKMQKAVDLYSLTWMPKGARLKITWRMDYFHLNNSPDETEKEDIVKQESCEIGKINAQIPTVKEHRQEFGEEIFHERYLPSVVAINTNTSTVDKDPVIDLTNNCPISELNRTDSFPLPNSNPATESVTSSKLLDDYEGEENNSLSLEESRKRSIFHQKDFYACLFQSHTGKYEHYYHIEDELEPEEQEISKEDKKSSRAGRIQFVKNSVKVKISEDLNVPDAEGRKLKFSLTTSVFWTVPMDLTPGEYYIEIGSRILGQCAVTETFIVTEAFGVVDTTTVGTWCICTESKRSDSPHRNQWIRCELCNSWQHWHCYEQKDKSTFDKRRKALNRLRKRKINLEEKVAQVKLHKKMFNLNDERIKRLTQQLSDGGVLYALGRRLVTNVEILLKLEGLEGKLGEVTAKYTAILNSQELCLVGHSKTNKRVPEDHSFHCWMCFDSSLNKFDLLQYELEELELRRLQRLVMMIKKASGGYSRKSVETKDGKKTKNKYSTPNSVVCYLGVLLEKYLTNSDELSFIDLGAGEGRLSSILPPKSRAVERDRERFLIGRDKVPNLDWMNEDVLSMSFLSQFSNQFDVVVSNPDFETALPFIVVAFFLLNRKNEDARLFFILPSDFFEASALRSRIYKLLPFRIETEHKLGHLSYLDCDPKGQKLTVDSLFVLKRGRTNKFEHKTVNARLGGML